MAQKTGAFDSRDVLSLIAAILSIIVFACFWQFRGAHASLPYALYQYMVRPVAAISIPFFISSHFRIIRLPGRVLFILKAVCCVLGIAYILLVAILKPAAIRFLTSSWQRMPTFRYMCPILQRLQA